MQRKIVIEMALTSQSGDPSQLEAQLNEITSTIKRCVESEQYDDDNKIVYNDWDDPHICDFTISMKVTTDT